MIIMAIVGSIIMTAVLPADVMAVNPMVPVSHMAWSPSHFIVARPIARAMVVEWPVVNLDFDALRSNSGWKKETHRNNSDEQKFVFNHTRLIRAHPSRHVGLSRTAD
jgi:hypothetical protein